MAGNRPVPPRRDSGQSRILRANAKPARVRAIGASPTFTRLTVLWVQSSGVPFDTTGFFARLTRDNGTLAATANFDRYGVVRFNNIRTLTTESYTLRLFNENGVLFRTRTIPAGVQTFAIIG